MSGVIGFIATFSGVYSIIFTMTAIPAVGSIFLYKNNSDTNIGVIAATSLQEIGVSFTNLQTINAGESISIAVGGPPGGSVTVNDIYLSIIQIV